jgi:flavin reductase (DIM6/NTAB) family NADH-FMN oxidoreductase RutF
MTVSTSEHLTISPRVLYVGTPVMLLSTSNSDGTANLSPASSYWALGQMLTLGLLSGGHTLANLHERPGLTVNFPSPQHWRAVEAIADTTGALPVPEPKSGRYQHVSDKFSLSGFTPLPSELVGPPRVAECALQFETTVQRITPGIGDYHIVEATVQRVHAHADIVPDGTQHIDPRSWQPMIYSFRHYFGIGSEHGHRPNSETARFPTKS